MSSLWLAVRSLIWTVALPGMVAGYVPWRYVGLAQASFNWRDPVQLIGLLLVGGGAGVLATCVWEFAYRGRGTLAPVDPPKHLVVQGLYRYVRNPMYVGVTTILLGELLIARTWALALYCGCWLVAVNLFIIGYEEPTLRRQFGASYEQYRKSVGRWIPRLPRDR
ncbi:MAG TPA: isoprenylcysteine carboxylmethyltransferase family protein [Gemmatimonadales bacterium]|nr:isoprenylcysteine carboxylmethyltransferase family protein [Gemmatimonadales bacterium]